MNELQIIFFGAGVTALWLFLRKFLRRRSEKNARRELRKALSKGDPEKVLAQLEVEISEKLQRIGKLEANAGALFGAEVDDLLHQEHLELRDLKINREIAIEFIKAQR